MADAGAKADIKKLPATKAKFPGIVLSAYSRRGVALPPDNIRALGSEYTSRAWDDRLSPGWGDFVYGLQFHLEFTETIIGRLASEPDSRKYVTAAGVDPDRLVAEAPARVRALTDVAQRVFTEYFRQCGL